jgi:hypothetical protein
LESQGRAHRYADRRDVSSALHGTRSVEKKGVKGVKPLLPPGIPSMPGPTTPRGFWTKASGVCPKIAPRHASSAAFHENCILHPRSLRKRPLCLNFPARKSRARTDGPPTCTNVGYRSARMGKGAPDFKHEHRFRSEWRYKKQVAATPPSVGTTLTPHGAQPLSHPRARTRKRRRAALFVTVNFWAAPRVHGHKTGQNPTPANWGSTVFYASEV